MKDREFLIWLHNRIIHVYDENKNVDYLHKLRAVISAIDKNVETPNICSDAQVIESEYSKIFGVKG